MIYREEIRDLFSVSNDYVLAHCISADFALGAGIAIKFRDMGVKDELTKYSGKNLWAQYKGHGFMIPTFSGRETCNLVTKELYWHKPTYQTVREALESTRDWVVIGGKIAMPQIACGLDGLNWNKVRAIIKDVFCDTEIEILVCKLK